jgi:hypothetical protein
VHKARRRASANKPDIVIRPSAIFDAPSCHGRQTAPHAADASPDQTSADNPGDESIQRRHTRTKMFGHAAELMHGAPQLARRHLELAWHRMSIGHNYHRTSLGE